MSDKPLAGIKVNAGLGYDADAIAKMHADQVV
jgi:hypothetical protein